MMINKISSYSNNKNNSKQSFGMALKKINLKNMNAKEINVITENLEELEKIAKDVDLDIKLYIRINETRAFDVRASYPGIKLNKKYFSSASCGHDSSTEESYLKTFLLSNANSAKDEYLKNSIELAKEEFKKARLNSFIKTHHSSPIM